MTRQLFVTGTDTDAGKTHVSCAIVNRLRDASARVAAFKPVCTGVNDTDETDLDRLADASRCDVSDVAGEVFREPLSPPSAARAEDSSVKRERIDEAYRRQLASKPDYLLIEGAGGIRCPVTEQETILELITRWRLPVLIVSGIKLGAINHTLMTYEIAVRHGLQPKVILSEPNPVAPKVRESTIRELANRLTSAIAGIMPFDGELLNFDYQNPTISNSGSPLALDVIQSLFHEPPASIAASTVFERTTD